jgi:RNA polymerase sigma-70 factor (ECF subfamily)
MRELVAQFLQQRDERSFRKLYRRCTPKIFPLALRLLGGRTSEAEDVVQEVWIRAISGLDRFRWQSTLETWLCRITIRCCQEALRRQKRQVVSADLEDLPAAPPAKHIETVDLEKAIAALPEGYRQVLILHDIEGYTHGEIADLLHIETGTSKSQLFHARKKIRMSLQPAQS